MIECRQRISLSQRNVDVSGFERPILPSPLRSRSAHMLCILHTWPHHSQLFSPRYKLYVSYHIVSFYLLGRFSFKLRSFESKAKPNTCTPSVSELSSVVFSPKGDRTMDRLLPLRSFLLYYLVSASIMFSKCHVRWIWWKVKCSKLHMEDWWYHRRHLISESDIQCGACCCHRIR